MTRLRSVGALAACLLLVAVLNGLRPPALADARSYLPGADGWAHAPSASGRVLSVARARSVVRPRQDQPLVSQDVFVIVRVVVQVRNRSLPLGSVSLLTADGHTYTQLGDSGLDNLTLTQPGFSMTGNAVFEVPRERVPGSTLVVGTQSDMLVIYRAQLLFPGFADGVSLQTEVRLAEANTEVTR